MLQVVVQLALHEADPRVATVACWGLAVACHAQRQKKGPAGGAGAPGGSDIGAQMRALTGVPEGGAMKALVQVALTGTIFWHSPSFVNEDPCDHCAYLCETPCKLSTLRKADFSCLFRWCYPPSPLPFTQCMHVCGAASWHAVGAHKL